MKIRVNITLKENVLDPQGKAVERALQSLGFPEVRDVRIGRLVEFSFAGATASVRPRVEAMCQQLLANPVIEQYRIETIE